jgi:hypothetical protein
MFSELFVPDTVNYMIAGYVVLAVIISTYIMSMFWRWNRTKKEYLRLKDQE